MNLEIIVIDDDEAVLFIHELYLKEYFSNNNFKTFKGAQSAIQYLNSKEHFALEYLVFIDINMPRISGWGFIEAVEQKSFYHKLHIVMASSSIDARDREKAATYSQVIYFCEKPINEEFCIDLRRHPVINHLLQEK